MGKIPILANFYFPRQDFTDLEDIDLRQRINRMVPAISKECAEPSVLILTDIYDFESTLLGNLLIQNKIDYARINSSYLPDNFEILINYSNEHNELFIKSNEQLFTTKHIKVVLWRNFHFDNFLLAENKIINGIYNQEWHSSLNSLFAFLNSIHINSPIYNSILTNPVSQLELAKKVGFKIPHTIITNNRNEIKNACESPNNWITKSIGLHHVISEKTIYSYYAKTSQEINDFIEQNNAPVLLQQKIKVKSDLRITFIKEQLFAIEILRPKSKSNFVDYKMYPLNELELKEYKMSQELIHRCQAFISKSNLFYGAMDFIIDSNNNLYFLEVNYCPDWQWLTLNQINHKISNTLVDSILQTLNNNEIDNI